MESAAFDVRPATNVREFAVDVGLVKVSNMSHGDRPFSTFSSQYNLGRNGCPKAN